MAALSSSGKADSVAEKSESPFWAGTFEVDSFWVEVSEEERGVICSTNQLDQREAILSPAPLPDPC